MLFFTKPQYLIFLLIIPIIIFIHIASIRLAKKKAIKFANFDAISKIKGVDIFSKNLTVLYIHLFIIVFVVFSVSGMSIVRQVETSKLSFVIAIDSSKSMGSTDILPSRLEASKKAAIDFLKMIPEGTKIGIVSFSGSSYIDQEPTEDKALLKNAIQKIDLKSVGGTDIFNALTTSANLLREEETKSIILISDGSINLNIVQDITDYAEKYGVIIYSLGVGTSEGGTDAAGGVFKISEDTLSLISENSGGRYYNIGQIDNFYSSFNDLIEIARKNVVMDLSFYLMLSALFLFLIEFILISTKYRTLP